jgi:hypothetical protein
MRQTREAQSGFVKKSEKASCLLCSWIYEVQSQPILLPATWTFPGTAGVRKTLYKAKGVDWSAIIS